MRSWRTWRRRWASRSSSSSAAGRVEERVERHLGVDHDRLAAGQVHDEVGAQHAVGELDLLGEVAAVDQAGELDRPAQVHLAPPAADLGLAQGGGQRRGLAAQRLGGEPHVGDLLAELSLPRRAGLVEVAQLVVQAHQPLADQRLVGRLAAVALLQGGDDPGVLGTGARPEQADEPAEHETDEQRHRGGQDVHGASMDQPTDNATEPPGPQSRSTITGAWSEGDPLPCAGSRSSRSMNAPVTRPASEGEATTKSILSPRSRSKRWR